MQPSFNGVMSGVVVLPVAAVVGSVVWLVDNVFAVAASLVLLVVHGMVDGVDVDDRGALGSCSI